MELSVIQDPDLVVALDVGTTYSGYAWQWRSDFLNNRSNIEFNMYWGVGALQLHKTSTCILLKRKYRVVAGSTKDDICHRTKMTSISDIKSVATDDFEVDSFGHLATKRYMALSKEQSDDISGTWYFFRDFKLLLYKKECELDMMIEDQLSQPLPLRTVLSLFIGALRKNFLDMMKQRRQEVKMKKTLWVVTIPAIWPDPAKKFMREAAEMCGIENRHLLLALEPEAAAISCVHLPSEQRENMGKLGMKGHKFLTVDLGGGTVDLAAIEVQNDGFLGEIKATDGKCVGGKRINDAFFQVCHDSFDGEGWREVFTDDAAVAMMKMEDDFENKKVTIGSSDPRDEYIALELPSQMRKMLENGTLKLKEDSQVRQRFRFVDGEFLFNSAFIREVLFKETCSMVHRTIHGVLKDLKDVEIVVLVGGFAQSPIVVEKIQGLLSKDFPGIEVFVPTSPFDAVLKGAVLYGHNPRIFRTRISRATYGVKAYRPFDEKLHAEEKKVVNNEDRRELCKDIFSIHVRKGDSVFLESEQPSKKYTLRSRVQRGMNIPIFTSSKNSPMYVTDEGCRQIGQIQVDMSDPSNVYNRERSVRVKMIYGGTELSVIATDESSETPREFNAEINFDRS